MPPHLRCRPGEGWSGPCTARHTSKETWEGTKDRGPSPNQRHLRARVLARTRTPQSGPRTGRRVHPNRPTRRHGLLLWGGTLCRDEAPFPFSTRLGSALSPHRRPRPCLFSRCALLSAHLGLRGQSMPTPQEPPAPPAPSECLAEHEAAAVGLAGGCAPAGRSPCKCLRFVCGWRADESLAPQPGSAGSAVLRPLGPAAASWRAASPYSGPQARPSQGRAGHHCCPAPRPVLSRGPLGSKGATLLGSGASCPS